MKILKLFGYALLAMTMTMANVACGDDDDKSSTNGGNEEKTLPDPSPTSEKAFFEETARLFMQKVSASDFDELRNLAKYVRQQDWEGDDIGDFFEEAIDACEELGYTGYSNRLYRAANFCGEFSVENGKWKVVKKGGDVLKFTFNDQNGKTCVLQVKASGNPARLGGELFNYSEKDWNYDYSRYEETRIEQAFMVPEKAEASLTQNGKALVSAIVNIDINSSGELNLAKDTYSVSADVNACGYNVIVSRARVENGKKAIAETTIKKNGELLLSAKANANGEVRLSNNELRLLTAGAADAEIDILGRIQVKAKVGDIDRLVDLMEVLDEYRYEQAKFDNALNDANNLISADVFFNGSSARNCYAKLIASAKQGSNGMKYEPTPAIFFNDGTSYSFESYFDETYFKTVINTFESLCKDFESLIDDFDDDDDVATPKYY